MAKINEIATAQADETIKINKQKVTVYTSITTNDFVTAVHTIADSCFVDGEFTLKHLHFHDGGNEKRWSASLRSVYSP